MTKKILSTLMMMSLPIALSASLEARAQEADGIPTLVVTNKPISEVVGAEKIAASNPEQTLQLPSSRETMGNSIYTKPVQLDDITANRVMDNSYFEGIDTAASQKIGQIQGEMYSLQGQIADVSEQLKTLEIVGQDLAANYYAAVATINTQLQSGTTPGNPRLKQRLGVAEDALDTLSGNVSDLNKIAVQIADLATVSNYLQQQARATYGLSGSVEEDHVKLAQLEDEVSNTAVAIERLLNNVNDNITRAAAYMTSERANLRTLALAITNGDLFGKSLSNRPFSLAGSSDIMNTSSPVAEKENNVLQSPRPLIKIKFDRPDVDYTQALYMSVNEAMEKYPTSTFELIAVSPGAGNPAKLAIESTKARRNAEKVLRNMVEMGVDSNRINLANLTQDEAQFNEVHLFIR